MTPAAGDELLAILRAWPRAPERVREIVLGSRDPAALTALAFRNGVVSLLGACLEGAEDVPAELGDVASRQLAADRARHRWFRTTLVDVVSVLEASGVPVVPLKGPSLAARLYPEPAARPSSDLDLLIARARLDVASAALAERGFAELAESRWQRVVNHQAVLVRPGAPWLELHYRLTPTFGLRLRPAELIERSRPPAGGMPWRTLDPADELIFLAAHAAKHRFERLIWLVDLALFADRLSPAGWLDTARRAKAAKAGPVLALTLSLLRELLAADVPTPEALGLSLGGVSARLAHAACARAWLDPDPHGLAGRVVKASAHFALCQDLPALARDASGSLARPVLRLLAAVADRSSER